MIKKLILLFICIFSFSFHFSYASVEKDKENLKKAQEVLNAETAAGVPSPAAIKNVQDAQTKLERSQACAGSWDCIDQESFMIETGLFSVGWKELKDGTTTSKELINKWLGTIIQKLMIALWVISLLIMTVWAWYIILYHWEDEYLTKWKWIFTAWLVSLVIALSSYYIVNAIAYILYK